MPLPEIVSLGLPIVGDLIGGLLGRSGQNSANQANLQIARENREWQERMSSTAYQRATKDLEASGLNRILALGSPSSTPAGNTATMLNKNAALQEGISKASGTALQAARLRQEIKNMKAQEKLTDAQRKAIAPASTLGDIIEGSREKIDYPDIIEEIPANFKRRVTQQNQRWKKVIEGISDSLGLQRDKATTLLLDTLDEMDIPSHVDTVEKKLKWALDHPEQIKNYLLRKRGMGY